jgi:hypothetical protein
MCPLPREQQTQKTGLLACPHWSQGDPKMDLACLAQLRCSTRFRLRATSDSLVAQGGLEGVR